MRLSASILFYIIVIITPSSFLQAQGFSVMSFNIRLDTPVDGENRWDNRKQELSKMIDFYNPDFVGLQEVLHNQLVYVDSSLQDYCYVGVGRDDGKEKGEYSPIFFNSNKYVLIKHQTFWLSEKPDSVSVGWDAALPRICTYGLFANKLTGNRVHVFNTHFDHVGKKAVTESARLIQRIIEQLTTANSRVVLMGDFNSEPGSEPIEIISRSLQSALNGEKGIYGPKGTFNAFNDSIIAQRQIDYVFVQNFNVLSYRHVDDRMPNNRFISDHFPILVKLKDNFSE